MQPPAIKTSKKVEGSGTTHGFTMVPFWEVNAIAGALLIAGPESDEPLGMMAIVDVDGPAFRSRLKKILARPNIWFGPTVAKPASLSALSAIVMLVDDRLEARVSPKSVSKEG